MPYLIKELEVDRVDLVDEGANSAAFIQLYKRKERKSNMGVKEILEALDATQGAAIKAELDKLTSELTKAREDLRGLMAEKEALAAQVTELTKSASGGTPPPSDEEVLKSLPESARDLFQKMRDQKEAAEEELRKAKEAEEHAAAVAKATELKALPIEQDKLVGIVKGASPELMALLTSVAAAMNETVLNKVGDRGADNKGGDSNAAWAQIEAKAEELVKREKVSKAKAIAQVVEDNPDLYKKYLQGGAN